MRVDQGDRLHSTLEFGVTARVLARELRMGNNGDVMRAWLLATLDRFLATPGVADRGRKK